MPMGLKKTPAIHQCCVTAVLRHLIGKFSHIYLDDIIIWSDSLETHEHNVHPVLEALRAAQLYVNLEKTHLFCIEIDLLGHHISVRGIEAGTKKVNRILNCTSVTHCQLTISLANSR